MMIGIFRAEIDMQKTGLIFPCHWIEDGVSSLDVHETGVPIPQFIEFACRDDESVMSELVNGTGTLLESAPGSSSRFLCGPVEHGLRLLQRWRAIGLSQCLAIHKADLVAMGVVDRDTLTPTGTVDVLNG